VWDYIVIYSDGRGCNSRRSIQSAVAQLVEQQNKTIPTDSSSGLICRARPEREQPDKRVPRYRNQRGGGRCGVTPAGLGFLVVRNNEVAVVVGFGPPLPVSVLTVSMRWSGEG